MRRLDLTSPSMHGIRPAHPDLTPSSLSQVVAACRKATRLPLITKMSPNVVSIAPYAQAAEAAGSDALSIMNSFPAMAIDIETRRPRLANVTGGLTGPCIKPIAIKLVWDAAQAVKIPIIGNGDITGPEKAKAFQEMSGVDGLMIGRGSIGRPWIFEEVRHFLSGKMISGFTVRHGRPLK